MDLNLSDPERITAEKLIELALAEDLQDMGDLTCRALIGEDERGEVQTNAQGKSSS